MMLMPVPAGSALDPGLAAVSVRRGRRVEDDLVAVEAPLEIRIGGEPLLVTMRTPGCDRELAAGLLYSEGIVEDVAEILAIELRAPDDPLVALGGDPCPRTAIADVHVAAAAAARSRGSERAFHATSACGVCGKRRLEDLDFEPPVLAPLEPDAGLLGELPERMRRGQRLFDACGGIHAAALFASGGRLLDVREDIGRHNAVDKIVGAALLRGELPLAERILAVSGRAGFEVVQKALRARIPCLVAVGAASSFAVDLARSAGMALYSFTRAEGANRHL